MYKVAKALISINRAYQVYIRITPFEGQHYPSTFWAGQLLLYLRRAPLAHDGQRYHDHCYHLRPNKFKYSQREFFHVTKLASINFFQGLLVFRDLLLFSYNKTPFLAKLEGKSGRSTCMQTEEPSDIRLP